MAKKWVNEQKIPSPYERWPGFIIVPLELGSEMFTVWWEKSREIEKDKNRPAEYKMFEERHNMVLDCQIEGLDWDEINPDGSNLPSLAIANFVIAATQDALVEARTLPNLHEPSNDITSSTETS